MELSSSNIKKFLIFSQKKTRKKILNFKKWKLTQLSHISEVEKCKKNTLENVLYFREWYFQAPSSNTKNFLYFFKKQKSLANFRP